MIRIRNPFHGDSLLVFDRSLRQQRITALCVRRAAAAAAAAFGASDADAAEARGIIRRSAARAMDERR